MKQLVRLSALLVAVVCCSAIPAHASDFFGVFAIVDKVTFEPATGDRPDRIVITGLFAISKQQPGDQYDAPQRGYMYFKLGDKADQARREWNDLKSLAGKKEVVAFGAKYEPKGRVRKADEKAENPDVYQPSQGLLRVRTDSDFIAVKALREASKDASATK